MDVLLVHHMDPGPTDALSATLAAGGARLDAREAWRGGRLPADDRDHAGLVVFGGVMNALDDDAHPHLADTVALIRAFHAADKPVLGLCLGAQLIARAAGARVRLGAVRERGFTRLEATPAAAADPLLAGLAPPWWLMQWHDDVIEPPEGATLLMTGAVCRVQAFRLGRATYGFQCHFEVTPAVLDYWLVDENAAAGEPDRAELRARIATETATHADTAMAFCRAVAARWATLMGDGQAI